MINYGCLHRLVGIVITPNYIFNLQGQKILSFFFFFHPFLKSYYILNSLSVKTKSFPETPLPPRSQQQKKKIKVPSEALSIKREKILRPIQS